VVIWKIVHEKLVYRSISVQLDRVEKSLNKYDRSGFIMILAFYIEDHIFFAHFQILTSLLLLKVLSASSKG
jgi:hypothetical protein